MFRNGRIFNIEFFNAKLRHALLLDMPSATNDDHDDRYIVRSVDIDHLKVTDGLLTFSDEEKVVSHSRQDSFLEQIDFTVSETGGTVTGSLEKENGGDLTQFWSDDFDVLDCTPPKTVDLTGSVGTDTEPVASFVYILFSAKTTLVVNTSWPASSVEHIRVASIVLQSAATTGTNGALMNRNWNDASFGITNPKGGAIASNERMRKNHAEWDSGVALTVTGSGTGTVTLASTAGAVYQLNKQSFPAIDIAAGDDLHLVNLSGGEFSTTVNLVADITTLADGVTSIGNNKYFNIVIWGAQNRTNQESHLMCNLPIGQYGKQSDATIDAMKFSVSTIPDDFRGIGFLVSELTFQLTGAGSTWTLIQERSLLGLPPSLIPGGGTTNNISTFVDTAFEVFDNLDDTKRIAFQASSIATGTTRTITMANANVDLALLTATPGTAAADKALIVDSSKNIADINDLTIDGELKGSRAIFQFSLDAVTVVIGNAHLKFGEVLTTSGKDFKGAVMARPGSILGYGLSYDVTVNADSSALITTVGVEGSAIVESISGSVANNKTDFFTQARGTDLFSAGDVLVALISGVTVTIAKVILYVEVQFDT